MSRRYSMQIWVKDHDVSKINVIEHAIQETWAVDTCGDTEWIGDGYLCGGESEDEFAERIKNIIWEANGAPCVVELAATYLEAPPPCEWFTFHPDTD